MSRYARQKETVRGAQLKAETKRRAIRDRDNSHAAKIGGIQSTWSGAATTALLKVDSKLAAEIAALTRPVITAAETEQRQQVIKTLGSARAFLADLSALRGSEFELNDFLRFAGLPLRAPIAANDANAAAFVERAERALNPPTPVVQKKRDDVVLSADFTDLVAS